jgi:hypothetical protein
MIISSTIYASVLSSNSAAFRLGTCSCIAQADKKIAINIKSGTGFTASGQCPPILATTMAWIRGHDGPASENHYHTSISFVFRKIWTDLQ